MVFMLKLLAFHFKLLNISPSRTGLDLGAYMERIGSLFPYF